MSNTSVVNAGVVYSGATLKNNIQILDSTGSVVSPLVAPWNCSQTVYTYTGNAKLGTEVISSKTIDIDSGSAYFKSYLSEAETLSLPIGTYVIELIIRNGDAELSDALTDKVRISFTITD